MLHVGNIFFSFHITLLAYNLFSGILCLFILRILTRPIWIEYLEYFLWYC